MKGIHINRGFETMIPKEQEPIKEDYFKYHLKFKLFKKEFVISLNIK